MDSMALCHYLVQSQVEFSIAHCNFNLRGEESNADEAFVRAFAENSNLKFHHASFDTEVLAKQNKTSIEEEARNLRYNFFSKLTEECKIDAFLTAHHLDDQVETILMRIISGTGIQGIQGIPFFRKPNYYRPLLSMSRNQIIQYIKLNKIDFREDSSNRELVYKRNKIRHEILPKIEELNPSYRDAFLHISQVSNEINELLIDIFTDLKTGFQADQELDLKNYIDKKYLPTMLQFILNEYSPNKTEILQLAQKISTPELKKFQCGSTWLEVKRGIIRKISL